MVDPEGVCCKTFRQIHPVHGQFLQYLGGHLERHPFVGNGEIQHFRKMLLMPVDKQKITGLQIEGSSRRIVYDSAGDQQEHFKKVMGMTIDILVAGIGVEHDPIIAI